MMTSADETRINLTLGMMPQPGLAGAYPDLVRMSNRIYEDRIAKMPWVPPSWLASVQELQAKYPLDLMRPSPGFDSLGRRGHMAPSWADTDDKLKAWHTIWKDYNDAVVAYAQKQSEIGQRKLNALYADAAFWNAAYKVAVVARDLPSNIVKGVAGGVSDFVGTFLPDSLKAYAKWITLALALLIVGGLVLWYRNKLGGLVRGFKGGAK